MKGYEAKKNQRFPDGNKILPPDKCKGIHPLKEYRRKKKSLQKTDLQIETMVFICLLLVSCFFIGMMLAARSEIFQYQNKMNCSTDKPV